MKQRNDHRRAGQSQPDHTHRLKLMGGTYLSQTDYTNPKRQRGNALTPSLALGVSVTTGAGVIRKPSIFPTFLLRTPKVFDFLHGTRLTFPSVRKGGRGARPIPEHASCPILHPSAFLVPSSFILRLALGPVAGIFFRFLSFCHSGAKNRKAPLHAPPTSRLKSKFPS